MAEGRFADTVRREAAGFDLELDDATVERFTWHYELLLKWNARLNLTRIVNPAEAARQHFLESAWLTRAVPVAPGRFFDVGSGAGFPGMPVACLWPDSRAVLVEPAMKRSVFLKEVGRSLGLENVEVRNERFDPAAVGPDDLVTARALDRFSDLLPLLAGAPPATVALFSDEDLLRRAAGLQPSRASAIQLIPGSKQRFLGVYSVPRST